MFFFLCRGITYSCSINWPKKFFLALKNVWVSLVIIIVFTFEELLYTFISALNLDYTSAYFLDQCKDLELSFL